MTPDEIVDLTLSLDTLSELPRTGWLLRGVTAPESIAAHTLGVAVVATAMTDALRAQGQSVDGERVLRMALLHDAPEARTGDVPMPSKTPALREALFDAERELVGSMLPPAWADTWALAARDGSLEARIVRAADKIQMMTKALRYEQQGRGRLDEFWNNPGNFRTEGLALARDLYEVIARRAGRTIPG